MPSRDTASRLVRQAATQRTFWKTGSRCLRRFAARAARPSRGQRRQHLVHRHLRRLHRQARSQDRCDRRVSRAEGSRDRPAYARVRPQWDLFSGFLSDGRPLDPETIEKLFECSAQVQGSNKLSDEVSSRLGLDVERHSKAMERRYAVPRGTPAMQTCDGH